MMTYVIFPMKFTSAVHFGDAADGGGLDEVTFTCRADTFFSALCSEAAAISSKLLNRLLDKVQNGEVRFSDLMPYFKPQGSDGPTDFYIPRPIMPAAGKNNFKVQSFMDIKKESSLRKQIKKRKYIRASELSFWLKDREEGSNHLSPLPEFGISSNDTRFNSRTRKPYETGSFYFNPDSGLYVLIGFQNEEDISWIESLIKFTGLSGIGGRRSSGSGKFELNEYLILDGYETEGKDDKPLYEMLNAEDALHQMTLSSLIPADDEVEFVKDGTGKLVRRGGFSYSDAEGTVTKNNGVYMLESGSCFKKRLNGRIVDVSSRDMGHPIYKYGKGLYVGLKL